MKITDILTFYDKILIVFVIILSFILLLILFYYFGAPAEGGRVNPESAAE